MEHNNFRKQFVILNKITFLDSCSLVQKPQVVIKENDVFYEEFPINTHSKDNALGVQVDKRIEQTRELVASMINAHPNEIIFTTGTTQSLNLISQMIAPLIKDNSEIILSNYNHSSNMVPYFENYKNKNIKFIYCDTNEQIISNINKNTALVAISQVNNSLLINHDMHKIYEVCKKNNTILINDAAQAILHDKVDLNDADVIAISSNKMFGPTGIGVLAIKKSLLDKLEPVTFGGGATKAIKGEKWVKATTNKLYEPGTPNLAGLFQFYQALLFMKTNINDEMKAYLKSLSNYLYDELKKLPDIEIISHRDDFIALFHFKHIPAHDVVSYLGFHNVYIRAGDFCVKAAKEFSQNDGYIRASLSYYNNKNDIDTMIDLLKKGDYFEFL